MFLCYLEYMNLFRSVVWVFFFHKQTFHEPILDVYHLITAGKTTVLHYHYLMTHLFIRL